MKEFKTIKELVDYLKNNPPVGELVVLNEAPDLRAGKSKFVLEYARYLEYENRINGNPTKR